MLVHERPHNERGRQLDNRGQDHQSAHKCQREAPRPGNRPELSEYSGGGRAVGAARRAVGLRSAVVAGLRAAVRPGRTAVRAWWTAVRAGWTAVRAGWTEVKVLP